MANSVGAVLPVSTLFAQICLSENFGTLQYAKTDMYFHKSSYHECSCITK